MLSILHDLHPDAIIVEGDCRGADQIAGRIAANIFGPTHVEKYPVDPGDWTTYGKSAGPMRNRQMVKESFEKAKLDGHHLEYGVAFHHNLARSKGTKDMVSVLEYHGIPVLKIG